MNSNLLYNRIMTIFGALMVFFYFALGFYILFSDNLAYIEKYIRNILGYIFILYGIFRAVRAYTKIKETFFNGRSFED